MAIVCAPNAHRTPFLCFLSQMHHFFPVLLPVCSHNFFFRPIVVLVFATTLFPSPGSSAPERSFSVTGRLIFCSHCYSLADCGAIYRKLLTRDSSSCLDVLPLSCVSIFVLGVRPLTVSVCSSSAPVFPLHLQSVVFSYV